MINMRTKGFQCWPLYRNMGHLRTEEQNRTTVAVACTFRLSSPRMSGYMLASITGRTPTISSGICGRGNHSYRSGILTESGKCLRKSMCRDVRLSAATMPSIERFSEWVKTYFIKSFYKRAKKCLIGESQ